MAGPGRTQRRIAWLAGIAVVAAGVAVSTFATLSEGGEDASCPDVAFGCVETGTDGAIRVAALLPLSGSRATVGRAARAGVDLALEAHGDELLGHRVVPVYRDDRCSAEAATGAARLLALDTPQEPPIAVVIGAPCPQTTEPVAQILSDSGIPLVSWASAEVSFRDPPPGRSFYVPVGPATGDERRRFASLYRERYGSSPPGAASLDGFRAATVVLEALDQVAREGSTRGVLIPRTALREALRRLTP